MQTNIAAEIPNIAELQSLARHEHALTWEMPDGRIVIRPVLNLSVFFANGYSPEGRESIAKCFDYFMKRWGEHIHGKQFGDGKYARTKAENFGAWRSKILTLGPTYQLCAQVSSEPAKDVAAEYKLSVLTSSSVREQSFGELSHLRARLPWRTLIADVHQFTELVRFMSDTLAVKHGYAGLSLALPYDFDRMLSFEYQLAQQFSGLMIDTYGFSGKNHLKNEFIKGVDWLTIIGDDLGQKLGGRAAIRAQLSQPAIQVEDYAAGLIVQAGDYPSLGAVEDGLPAPYVAVNRVLKPLRIPNPDSLHHYMPDRESFDMERSAKWYARFDVPEPDVVKVPEHRARGLPGEEVPETGVWWTPALERNGVERHFAKGERFPSIEYTPYGAVIWYLRSDATN